MTRILLVEDDARFAAAVIDELRAQAWDVVHCTTVEAALAALRQMTPDLGIIDLGLPDGDGLEVVARLGSMDPPIPSLVVTVFDSEEVVRNALARGAVGYLIKGDPMATHVRAVQACLAGDSPLSPQAARSLVRPMHEQVRKARAALARLSPREKEVALMLAKGMSYSDVGVALGIETTTIQTYVKILYRKLQVSSKAELASLLADWTR